MKKRILVLGAGGFIGGHFVKHNQVKGHHVTGIDVKQHEFGIKPDFFIESDLSNSTFVSDFFSSEGDSFDEIYQLAADMGGAGYIFTGENDANVMLNSSSINLNVLRAIIKCQREQDRDFKSKIFFSSSACIYPMEKQESSSDPDCRETSAYPANPDSEYGWEKLFSERLYGAFARNYNLNTFVARFHNIFGPLSTWKGGKEKSPAALCRKVAEASDNGTIEIWGDGEQTRSFLYIDDCVGAVEAQLKSGFRGPVNIGSEEMVSINQMAKLITDISGKDLKVKHIKGPIGVRGRNSQNDLFRDKVGYQYTYSLRQGLQETYHWIEKQVNSESN
jgi:GDP-D-mannose 3',5'-epimerase